MPQKSESIKLDSLDQISERKERRKHKKKHKSKDKDKKKKRDKSKKERKCRRAKALPPGKKQLFTLMNMK